MSGTPRTIQLGEVTLEVAALPLGQLRRLIPVFMRCGRAFALGQVDEAALADLLQIIALATGRSAEQLDAMPCTYEQLLRALDTISDVCGLKPREEPSPGEALQGSSTASTPGTPSTAG